MEVRVGIRGGIVVDHDVYSLDVNTSTENVGSDEDAFFEGLESGIPTNTKRNCWVNGPEMEGGSNVPFLL